MNAVCIAAKKMTRKKVAKCNFLQRFHIHYCNSATRNCNIKVKITEFNRVPAKLLRKHIPITKLESSTPHSYFFCFATVKRMLASNRV